MKEAESIGKFENHEKNDFKPSEEVVKYRLYTSLRLQCIKLNGQKEEQIDILKNLESKVQL